jgi:hypothetical protein
MFKFSRITMDLLLLIFFFSILLLPITTLGIIKVGGQSDVLSLQDEQVVMAEEDSILFEIAGQVEYKTETEVDLKTIERMQAIPEPSSSETTSSYDPDEVTWIVTEELKDQTEEQTTED